MEVISLEYEWRYEVSCKYVKACLGALVHGYIFALCYYFMVSVFNRADRCCGAYLGVLLVLVCIKILSVLLMDYLKE